MKKTIDINCDMGEGMPNDLLLMTFIDSASIACGGHAGNEESIRETLRLVKKFGKKAGAHPSFADTEYFGRREMHLPDTELYNLVRQQLEFFIQICKEESVPCQHVKPHGALYNLSARDSATARIIATAVRDIDQKLVLIGLSGSCSLDEAKKLGLTCAAEAFADRAYLDNGQLAPRDITGAVYSDPEQVQNQVESLLHKQKLTSLSGKTIQVDADTICIHGDGKHALSFAKVIHRVVHPSTNPHE
jgi:UPF0271 protein